MPSPEHAHCRPLVSLILKSWCKQNISAKNLKASNPIQAHLYTVKAHLDLCIVVTKAIMQCTLHAFWCFSIWMAPKVLRQYTCGGGHCSAWKRTIVCCSTNLLPCSFPGCFGAWIWVVNQEGEVNLHNTDFRPYDPNDPVRCPLHCACSGLFGWAWIGHL